VTVVGRRVPVVGEEIAVPPEFPPLVGGRPAIVDDAGDLVLPDRRQAAQLRGRGRFDTRRVDHQAGIVPDGAAVEAGGEVRADRRDVRAAHLQIAIRSAV